MIEAYRRRSALAHFGLAGLAAKNNPAKAGLILAEHPHRAILCLRGQTEDVAFLKAVEAVLGLALPLIPNRTAAATDWKAFWMSPDEWWLVGKPDSQHGLAEALAAACSGRHAAIVDLSESRATLSLRGRQVRDFMARATSLDLHPRVFSSGQCAQTVFARANVLIDLADPAPIYEIYALKSFADHLWRWITKVGEDFDLAIEA